MNCFIIPDHLLKHLKDHHSVRINKLLRKTKFKNMIIAKLDGLAKSFNLSRKTYTCENGTTLPGTLVLSENTTGDKVDAAASQAHARAGNAWLFYKTIFGRDSLDDAGLTIVSSVHYDKNYNNCFWQGHQICYGDGDGKFFSHFVEDQTVISHELHHAVTQFFTPKGLAYIWQSGAINESLSDIFGVTCRQWLEKMEDPKTANWLVGDSCKGSEFPGKALRSMVPNDKAYSGDNQPSHMKDIKYGLDDNMKVHTNSKIGNVVFYRMCQNMDVPSWDKPIKIVYNAMPKLGRYCSYKSFGKALTDSAAELYGAAEVDAVKKALKDTGL
jgi:Zn-dependent metalloprotease